MVIKKVIVLIILISLFCSCGLLFKGKSFDFGILEDGVYSNDFFKFFIQTSDSYRIKSARISKNWDKYSVIKDLRAINVNSLNNAESTNLPPQTEIKYNDDIPRFKPIKKITRMSFLKIFPSNYSSFINFEIINLNKFPELKTKEDVMKRCSALFLENDKSIRTSSLNLLNVKASNSENIFIDNQEFISKTFSISRFLLKRKILFTIINDNVLKIELQYKSINQLRELMDILNNIDFY